MGAVKNHYHDQIVENQEAPGPEHDGPEAPPRKKIPGKLPQNLKSKWKPFKRKKKRGMAHGGIMPGGSSLVCQRLRFSNGHTRIKKSRQGA